MNAAGIAQGLGGARSSGTGYKVRCPTHDDQIASLQIDDKGDKVLVHCHAGCDQSTVIGELKTRGLWVNGHDTTAGKSRIVATYDYTDERKTLLYQVVRYDPKGFKQRRPTGAGWTWNLKGVRQVPYRLPTLIEGIEAGNPVFVVEGERDVAALADLGLVATCNAGGAGKWRSEWATIFAGADVYIAPDNDDAGRKHAAQVLQSLRGVAANVSILNLPGLPEKGDVSDWLAAGGSRDKLIALLEQVKPAPTLVQPSITDTDMANAQRLARQSGEDIRYTTELGWLTWDGKRFAQDSRGVLVQALAKATALRIFDEIKDAADRDAMMRHAKRSQSKNAIDAMIYLARSEPGIFASTADFDADPWLLNVQNGTIDLRTGTLRPHSRRDLLTKVTTIDFDPSADCVLFDRVLTQVTGGSDELYSYLQRLIGYLLTGLTIEQVIVFLYGLGANGKTVISEIVLALLGEYGIVAEPELVMSRRHGGISNDVAALRGRRVALMNETTQGSRFDEAKLKQLTGGDTLTGRFLYQEAFDFEPTHKLMIRGNHKPAINGTDEGIWRRLHLVPFAVQIPTADQDRNLLDKLKAELPGILRWAVEGCLAWQKDGLNPPDSVLSAVQDYREESDILGRFIEERCEKHNLAEIKSSVFFTAYQQYCELAAERWLPSKDLPGEIERRGFRYERKKYGRVFLGVRLKPNEYAISDER